MSLTSFYLEFFQALNNNNVEYMLVGGHAVNYHGYVRSTFDMDVWVSTTEKNLQLLYNALIQQGYKEDNCLNAVRHLKDDHMIKIPKDKSMIDVMDSFMMKSDFTRAYRNHETMEFNNILIKIIAFDDLLETKHKSNRPKDLLDVKELKNLKELREKSKGGEL